MSESARRKALRARFEQTRREAAVYLLRNRRTNRALLGSTLDLASVRNKLEFAQSTNTASALDHRLSKDIRQFGIDAFTLEVLEVLEVTSERTPEQVRADLTALEELWRERLDPSELY
jgi:hypothetical protein